MEEFIEEIIGVLMKSKNIGRKEAEAVVDTTEFRRYFPKAEEIQLWTTEEWAETVWNRFERPTETKFKEWYMEDIAKLLQEEHGLSWQESWELIIEFRLAELYEQNTQEVRDIGKKKMAKQIIEERKRSQ